MKAEEKAIQKLIEKGYDKPWFTFEYEIHSDDSLLGYGDSVEDALEDANKFRTFKLKKSDLKKYRCFWVCFLYEGEDPSIDTDHDGGKTKIEALKNLMSHSQFI